MLIKQIDVVAKLLKKGKKINKKDEKTGDTALHRAAFNGHTEILELLLQKGADATELNHGQLAGLHSYWKSATLAYSMLFVAFHHAVIRGWISSAKLLLENGSLCFLNSKFKRNPPGLTLDYNMDGEHLAGIITV